MDWLKCRATNWLLLTSYLPLINIDSNQDTEGWQLPTLKHLLSVIISPHQRLCNCLFASWSVHTHAYFTLFTILIIIPPNLHTVILMYVISSDALMCGSILGSLHLDIGAGSYYFVTKSQSLEGTCQSEWTANEKWAVIHKLCTSIQCKGILFYELSVWGLSFKIVYSWAHCKMHHVEMQYW